MNLEYDKLSDWKVSLDAFYHELYNAISVIDPITSCGITRIVCKYDVESIRSQCMDNLLCYFPPTLEDWDEGDGNGKSNQLLSMELIINPDVNAKACLPAAFYWLSTYASPEQYYKLLSASDYILNFLTGRQHLQKAFSSFIPKLREEAQFGCCEI
ncbi:hypothetical protein M422DRAFT_247228 [Sphaerobolus stellatus SS14]|nr:hypothetical protein M422DRAFT_247228 [Sphaerobolus stellatus SS14]